MCVMYSSTNLYWETPPAISRLRSSRKTSLQTGHVRSVLQTILTSYQFHHQKPLPSSLLRKPNYCTTIFQRGNAHRIVWKNTWQISTRWQSTENLSLIHISEPTTQAENSYAGC